MTRKIIFTLLFGFFVLSDLHAGTMESFTLENGLKVVLMEEHKAPVVTFQVWYKVGSRNEVTGQGGLSHLLEHMMFKGTPKYGKGEFSRIVAKNGGTENAFTGRDYTAYFENFAADRIDLSLALEADRMQNLLLDPAEFLLERDVVKEERRTRTDDDPYAFLIEQLYAISFLIHPYRQPIIGQMSDLDRLTRDDAYRYYKKYYIPQNATIVVVGDFDTQTLRPKIKKAFGAIPKAAEVPSQSVSPELPQIGERRLRVTREAQIPFVFAAYHAPNHQSPDLYPLTVLSQILSGGKSTRLYQSLVYRQQIALDAGGHYDGLTTDPDLFYFYAMAHPKEASETSVAALETALQAEIERVRSEAASDPEIQKAKNQIEAKWIMSADSNFYRGMQIGMAETTGAGYPFAEHFVENIRKVTSADIQRVARIYLTDDNKSIGILIPKKASFAAPEVKVGEGAAP